MAYSKEEIFELYLEETDSYQVEPIKHLPREGFSWPPQGKGQTRHTWTCQSPECEEPLPKHKSKYCSKKCRIRSFNIQRMIRERREREARGLVQNGPPVKLKDIYE